MSSNDCFSTKLRVTQRLSDGLNSLLRSRQEWVRCAHGAYERACHALHENPDVSLCAIYHVMSSNSCA